MSEMTPEQQALVTLMTAEQDLVDVEGEINRGPVAGRRTRRAVLHEALDHVRQARALLEEGLDR